MSLQSIAVKVAVFGAVVAVFPVLAQQAEPHPTCNHCSATYVPKSELDGYNERAIAHNLVDQQVRLVDVGKLQVGIGSIYRGKLGHARKPGKYCGGSRGRARTSERGVLRD